MSGNREFQQIVAAAPREVLKIYLSSVNVNVPASGTEIIDIYASSGCIGITQSMYYSIAGPTGATSGTHSINLTTTAAAGAFVNGVSNFGSIIGFNQKHFIAADASQSPTNETSQVLALTGNYFDDTVGLRLTYTNNTNATQTALRTYGMTYVERTRGN